MERLHLRSLVNATNGLANTASLAEYMVEARIVYINPLEAEVYRNFLRNGGTASESKGNSLVFGITER